MWRCDARVTLLNESSKSSWHRHICWKHFPQLIRTNKELWSFVQMTTHTDVVRPWLPYPSPVIIFLSGRGKCFQQMRRCHDDFDVSFNKVTRASHLHMKTCLLHGDMINYEWTRQKQAPTWCDVRQNLKVKVNGKEVATKRNFDCRFRSSLNNYAISKVGARGGRYLSRSSQQNKITQF